MWFWSLIRRVIQIELSIRTGTTVTLDKTFAFNTKTGFQLSIQLSDGTDLRNGRTSMSRCLSVMSLCWDWSKLMRFRR